MHMDLFYALLDEIVNDPEPEVAAAQLVILLHELGD